MIEQKVNPAQLNALTLAFVGDAVFELLVREHLARQTEKRASDLHRSAVDFVRAKGQCDALEAILPVLSEEEEGVFKRGRNAHTSHIPRGSTSAEYHAATGVEALFGYLHLCACTQRIEELFKIIVEKR